jgi:uncharacterized membrane protein YkoI
MVVVSAFCALSALAGAAVAQPAVGAQHRRGDQREAYQARRDGRMLPLREIVRRVAPMIEGARYIGFAFDSDSAIYTLKFLRDGVVIWVDVDGRTGRIIGRTDR